MFYESNYFNFVGDLLGRYNYVCQVFTRQANLKTARANFQTSSYAVAQIIVGLIITGIRNT